MQGKLGMSHGIFQNDVRQENNSWGDDFGVSHFWGCLGLLLGSISQPPHPTSDA